MRTWSRWLMPVALSAWAASCTPPDNTRSDAGDSGGTDVVLVTDTGRRDASDVPQGPTACNMLTDCDSCGAGNNCGWCTTSNTCLDGNDLRSNDGTCTGVTWIFDPTYCPDESAFCAMHNSTCDDCTSQAGCGLCPGMGCVPGTGDGPVIGGIVTHCDGWTARSSDCPASDGGADAGDVDAGGTDAGTDVPVSNDDVPDVATVDAGE